MATKEEGRPALVPGKEENPDQSNSKTLLYTYPYQILIPALENGRSNV